jgi:hypothetical protein
VALELIRTQAMRPVLIVVLVLTATVLRIPLVQIVPQESTKVQQLNQPVLIVPRARIHLLHKQVPVLPVMLGLMQQVKVILAVYFVQRVHLPHQQVQPHVIIVPLVNISGQLVKIRHVHFVRLEGTQLLVQLLVLTVQPVIMPQAQETLFV